MFDFSEFEVKGNVCRTYEDDSEEEDLEDQVAGEDLPPIQNEALNQDDAEDELFDGMLKIVKCSVKISSVSDGIDVCSILVIAIILVLMFFLMLYYLELYIGK